MADGELLDAREAMAVLGINENDLQMLVARGDLRAFRSAGTMKFRRDDVSSLKTEKGTEPTIIIPASGSRKVAGSGILPSVSAAKAASETGSHENSTGEIVLDDIELMPTDDASVTREATSAMHPSQTGATILETGSHTGEMTVLEGAEASTSASPIVTGSGRRVAPAAPAVAPAMSRVRAAVGPGVSAATSRRTHAVYLTKSASPIWTGVLILTSVVFMFAASIFGVIMTRGYYDSVSEQRIIPPYISHNSEFAVYRWCYDKTPGNPQDPKPSTEYGGGGGEGPQ